MTKFACIQTLRLILLIAIFWTVSSPTRPLHAMQGDETKLQVGDVVKIEYLGESYEGKITRFTGTGWPFVAFERKGESMEQFFPTARVELVRQAEATADNGGLHSEMRTWTDTSGKFEIEARLVEKTDEAVKLQRADGKTTTVPLEKLSEEDRQFIANLEKAAAEENPFKIDDDSPDKAAAVKDAIEPMIPDESDAMLVTAEAGDWDLEPDALDPNGAPQWLQKIAAQPTAQSTFSNPFHNRQSDLFVADQIGHATISMTNAFEKHAEVHLVDLTGEMKPRILKLPYKDGSVVAISPSGRQLLTMPSVNGRIKGRLEFRKVTNDDAIHVKSWSLADFFGDGGPDVTQATFIDNDHLLTFGKQITLWDLEKDAAIYSVKGIPRPVAALSVNRKQLAYFNGDALSIVNVPDGRVLGTSPAEAHGIQALAFSPSGEFIAGFGSGYARIWSASDGKLIRELNFGANAGGAAGLAWPSENYLLVNNSLLVDISLRVGVWKYEQQARAGKLQQIYGDKFCYVSTSNNSRDKQPTRLVPATIPHRAMDDLTIDLNAEDLLVLQPGTRVGLKIDLPFAPEERKKIHDSIEQQFGDAGILIADDATLILHMHVVSGKADTISFRSIGGPMRSRGQSDIDYTPTTSRIDLLRDGKSV